MLHPRPRALVCTAVVLGLVVPPAWPWPLSSAPARDGSAVPTERAGATGPAPVAAPGTSTRGPVPQADPARWSDRRLAAQLTFSCVPADDTAAARRHAAGGVGGITLLGNDAPDDLARRLAEVRGAAPGTVRPFLASDEEGGQVQRLRHLIGALPPATVMGTWSQQRLRRTAYDYGRRMRSLGVSLDFAPVADLAVPGSYIDGQQRAFAHDPGRVSRKVRAWQAGMRDAGVLTALKHWPGHGHAVDSHTGPAQVPRRDVLEARDQVPFDDAFARGVPMVMVGHLTAAGLTEPGVPASLSPKALRALRAAAGPRAVIVTDSLSMAAATEARGLTPARAAVRALRAGADWALACTPSPWGVVRAIDAALDDGRLSRARAVGSVRRILALKVRFGLASRR